ncbi:MAG: complex I subunit 1 family protein, partial [Thermoanaerobaculia bacterium]|nr:complex I subunit 1 family protein [Thermoanaerobaculia bacterium]
MPGPLQAIHDAVGPTLFLSVVSPALKIAAVLAVVLGLISYLTFAERKVLGFLQVRTGPNRVGPWGLLQPIADVLKLLVKEDVVPNRAVRWAFILAPCLVVGPALVIFSVIPFGPPGENGAVNWFITDVNVGLLLIVALATIAVYGLILGGWASNSKFSLLGGLRSAAQMISYEVPQGFALVGPLLLAGSMSLVGIVEAQRDLGLWFVVPQFVA